MIDELEVQASNESLKMQKFKERCARSTSVNVLGSFHSLHFSPISCPFAVALGHGAGAATTPLSNTSNQEKIELLSHLS